ncbi:MAG: triose-phosphate isomerase [Actinomycetes bacterium]
MSNRTPIVAGNWKMHKTVAESEAFIQGLLPRVSTADGVEVAICPPFTSLEAMVDSTRGSRVEAYAQNMHEEASGAFTGEISAAMLSELDVHGVILGHSERRALFAETDELLAAKVIAAFEAGLKPMLCVGETDAEREAGTTEERLRTQVEGGLASVPDERLAEVAIESWWIACSVESWRSSSASGCGVAGLCVSQVGHAGGEVGLHGCQSGDDFDVLASKFR